MLKITNSFNDIDKDEKAIVYFTAQWCNPCKQLKPQFAKVAAGHSNHNYYIVDVDEIKKEYLTKYDLKSIPQIFVMNKGEIVKPILSRTADEIFGEIIK